jgi:hypothetical protein
MPAAMAQDFMKEITNYEPMIARLALDLQRKDISFDKEGNAHINSYGKPRLSEEGVRDIISRVRSVANSNTIFSYMTEEDFRTVMKQNARSICVRIYFKMKDWGIEATDYPVICDIVIDVMEMALRKAIGKNMQELVGATKSSQETIITESQQKSGIFEKMFGPSQRKSW